MTANGTKRTYRELCLLVRFRGTADIRCRLVLMVRGANDPQPTWGIARQSWCSDVPRLRRLRGACPPAP
jgi:hypothetical protein